MLKEFRNNTTEDDMRGMFKLFFIVLVGVSVITCILMYILIS